MGVNCRRLNYHETICSILQRRRIDALEFLRSPVQPGRDRIEAWLRLGMEHMAGAFQLVDLPSRTGATATSLDLTHATTQPLPAVVGFNGCFLSLGQWDGRTASYREATNGRSRMAAVTGHHHWRRRRRRRCATTACEAEGAPTSSTAEANIHTYRDGAAWCEPCPSVSVRCGCHAPPYSPPRTNDPIRPRKF